jgi:hypothetical protein
LKALEVLAPSSQSILFSRILGSVGLILGVLTIIVIIYSALV